MATSVNASGCKTGRGLKPSLAAVYSARQQRSRNHSRHSSPASGGGLGQPHSKRATSRSVERSRETKDGHSQASIPRQVSQTSQASTTSQDSSKSVSVDSQTNAALTPAPPQCLPDRRTGGSLNSQRRMIALQGVSEPRIGVPIENWHDTVFDLQHSGHSPRQAWQFSPRSRSRSNSSTEDVIRGRRCESAPQSRDGSITPAITPVSPPSWPSSPSKGRAARSHKCPSPVPGNGAFGKQGTLSYDNLGLLAQTTYLQMAAATPSRKRAEAHVVDPNSRQAEENLHNSLASGCRSGEQITSPRERADSDESCPTFENAPEPALREGWQVSLCQNVMLCCPTKLPTKDVFAQRKVPRPVSLEGSPRSCESKSVASPASPAVVLSPRGPSKERKASGPRREGRRLQRRPSEEACTPEEDSNLRNARLQMLLQEKRLSSVGLVSPREDQEVQAQTRPVATESSPRKERQKDEHQDHLRDRLWEVKLEIVRGLAAASSTRRLQDLEGD